MEVKRKWREPDSQQRLSPSYWSKSVVIFTNMQQKGSTIVQEKRLLDLHEVRGAF